MDDGDILFEKHVQARMRRDAPHTWIDPMHKKDLVYAMHSHRCQIGAESTIACKKRNDNVLKFVKICVE